MPAKVKDPKPALCGDYEKLGLALSDQPEKTDEDTRVSFFRDVKAAHSEWWQLKCEKTKGWCSPALEVGWQCRSEFFQRREAQHKRQSGSTSVTKNQTQNPEKYRKKYAELFDRLGLVHNFRSCPKDMKSALDLGCAPGGLLKYLCMNLRFPPDQIEGVTLAEEEGGVRMDSESLWGIHVNVIQCDLSQLDSVPLLDDTLGNILVGGGFGSFGIVNCGVVGDGRQHARIKERGLKPAAPFLILRNKLTLAIRYLRKGGLLCLAVPGADMPRCCWCLQSLSPLFSSIRVTETPFGVKSVRYIWGIHFVGVGERGDLTPASLDFLRTLWKPCTFQSFDARLLRGENKRGDGWGAGSGKNMVGQGGEETDGHTSAVGCVAGNESRSASDHFVSPLEVPSVRQRDIFWADMRHGWRQQREELEEQRRRLEEFLQREVPLESPEGWKLSESLERALLSAKFEEAVLGQCARVRLQKSKDAANEDQESIRACHERLRREEEGGERGKESGEENDGMEEDKAYKFGISACELHQNETRITEAFARMTQTQKTKCFEALVKRTVLK
uniref:Ribosomal RNA methyltransferase FtsJ domain-containing protein n=1 Tax=Chromera velia CCMP2878 TaxID=1169474 RepID=A0A0G4IFH5_9ALVE|eukprot:Cvel_13900.t1-p1 / transcript=Cvel_13900.t1 / gene=Cvel_13900 / organism=Chromera_velia_CCMP2878 / gene_product=hypothetical protein / transcript_product=hypothetical protein / location=Cvel_scaffold968:33722-40886(-) / protein_length=557 / sequence_SO=supercontig / SO=protein_coding / is_pseudo=false